MGWKYTPSKAERTAFAQKMEEINTFCHEHGIHHSLSGDSYYFCCGGNHYRVSNHSVAASNRGAFDESGNQIRELYHGGGEWEQSTINILAGKTRIIDIYNDLVAGIDLDARGRRKEN